jgi:predicted ArsR family transcriptional regulator
MDTKEKIIEVLSKHLEGLTFTQIAREVGMHRYIITKHIYELKGEGVVFIRNLKALNI